MSRSAIIFLVVVAIFVADTCAIRNCTGENEVNLCGSACQTTCSNLGENCPIINIMCNDACYCKIGYARITDDNSQCVPITDCPKRGENN